MIYTQHTTKLSRLGAYLRPPDESDISSHNGVAADIEIWAGETSRSRFARVKPILHSHGNSPTPMSSSCVSYCGPASQLHTSLNESTELTSRIRGLELFEGPLKTCHISQGRVQWAGVITPSAVLLRTRGSNPSRHTKWSEWALFTQDGSIQPMVPPILHPTTPTHPSTTTTTTHSISICAWELVLGKA